MSYFDREKRTEEARGDPRSTEEIIRQALAYEAESREDDDLSYNEPLDTLSYCATPEVFHTASQLLRSEIPEVRSLGAQILGQLGIPKRLFSEGSLPVLLPKQPSFACTRRGSIRITQEQGSINATYRPLPRARY